LSDDNKYNQRNIESLELLYGRGYLSMGGDKEVANIVSRVEVEAKDVLDVGCGLGGAAIALVSKHNAASVQGVDIDAGVLARADVLVEDNGLQQQIKLAHFEPGPLPLEDDSFDLAFVTAVSCHIENLVSFFSEIKRVIRPGGSVVGGEWFTHSDNLAFRRWDDLLRERGLNFHFVTRDEFETALLDCGFKQVSIVNRNAEMTELTQGYLERSARDLRQRLLEMMGDEGYADFLEWTRIRAEGLARGGSGYGHFIARKAAETGD
jgi:phosphoethanolamine N-methyltransferase